MNHTLLAKVPLNADAACCGHGVAPPWVITEDGQFIDGWGKIVKLLPPEMREAYIDLFGGRP